MMARRRRRIEAPRHATPACHASGSSCDARSPGTVRGRFAQQRSSREELPRRGGPDHSGHLPVGSLDAFLKSQPDHQLYGGEHAFTLKDYRSAIVSAGLRVAVELGPFDSIVNTFPNDHATLRRKILLTTPGRVLGLLLPADRVAAIGMWLLRRRRTPGRLFSFIARKDE